MAAIKKKYKGVALDLNQEFVCDCRADVSSLPTQSTKFDTCPTGSFAFVIEDSSEWMLSSDGEWKQVYTGGNSEIDSLDIATDAEVSEMLKDTFG